MFVALICSVAPLFETDTAAAAVAGSAPASATKVVASRAMYVREESMCSPSARPPRLSSGSVPLVLGVSAPPARTSTVLAMGWRLGGALLVAVLLSGCGDDGAASGSSDPYGYLPADA